MPHGNSSSIGRLIARELRSGNQLKDGTECEPYPVPDRVYVQWRWDDASKGKCSNEPFEGSTEYALPAVGPRTFTKADVEAVARELCSQAGHIPDVIVDDYGPVFAWDAYSRDAIAALSAIGEVEG